MLQEGQMAPDFTLPSSEGKDISLSDFRGKHVILYFYPKDNTPGCTAEACDFRDNMARLQSADTIVLGVSKDSLKSHDNFKAKHELNFPLLSDTEGEVLKLYEAWGEKKNYGKVYFGIIRSTFFIDKDGILQKAWYNVRAKGHVDRVLKELEAHI